MLRSPGKDVIREQFITTPIFSIDLILFVILLCSGKLFRFAADARMA